MRAPAIPPAEIGADVQPLDDDMRQGIERSFKGFVAIRHDGPVPESAEGGTPSE